MVVLVDLNGGTVQEQGTEVHAETPKQGAVSMRKRQIQHGHRGTLT